MNNNRIVPAVHANYELPTGASDHGLAAVKIDKNARTIFYKIENDTDVGFFCFLTEDDLSEAVDWLKHCAECEGKCKTESDLVERIESGTNEDSYTNKAPFYYVDSFNVIGKSCFVKVDEFPSLNTIDSFFSCNKDNELSYTSSNSYAKISDALYKFIVDNYFSKMRINEEFEVGLYFSVNPDTVPSENPFIFNIETEYYSKNMHVYIEKYGDKLIDNETHITVPISMLGITS